jgi:hypothetical protein
MVLEETQEEKNQLPKLKTKLRHQEEELYNVRQNVTNKFQTSFLRRGIADMKHLECTEVNPALETISDMAELKDWFHDQETLKLICDVYIDLQNCANVIGDPARNIFFISPVVIFVHLIAHLIYYPVMIALMVLLMFGRIQGWVTLITGFAGAAISAISIQSDAIAFASQLLGIVTGILAAAKGVTLEEDYLYARVEDLTVEVLRRAFGNMISKDAVFQRFWDRKTFEEFQMTIELKRADVEMVQGVRIFIELVIYASLVQNEDNFDQIYRLQTISKLVEDALKDPYNYLTLANLETAKQLERDYGFTAADAKQIKEIDKKIATVTSFCMFLFRLNQEALFPLVTLSDEEKDATTIVGPIPDRGYTGKATSEVKSRVAGFTPKVINTIVASEESPGSEEV